MLTPNEQLKLFHAVGYRPYNLALLEEQIVQLISWPFPEFDEFWIMARKEIDNPLSMEKFNIKQLDTPLNLLNKLKAEGFTAENVLSVQRMLGALGKVAFQ